MSHYATQLWSLQALECLASPQSGHSPSHPAICSITGTEPQTTQCQALLEVQVCSTKAGLEPASTNHTFPSNQVPQNGLFTEWYGPIVKQPHLVVPLHNNTIKVCNDCLAEWQCSVAIARAGHLGFRVQRCFYQYSPNQTKPLVQARRNMARSTVWFE